MIESFSAGERSTRWATETQNGSNGIQDTYDGLPTREGPIATAWMKAADLLVLLNTERTNIPGTFEHLASQRPILVLCPPSPTADVVREARAGVAIGPDDVDEVSRTLQEAYDRLESVQPALETHPVDLAEYSRPSLSRRLQRLFEEVRAQAAPASGEA